MRWQSEAQRRWGHSPAGEEALGGAEKVKEWDQATGGAALPYRVRAPKPIGNSQMDAHRERAHAWHKQHGMPE